MYINTMRKTMRKTNTCKRWKSCDAVPTGSVMMGCRPAYTSKGSKNWSRCNINKKFCKKEDLIRGCKLQKSNKMSNDQVDAGVLHFKMPYIWRHLDNKTRGKIVQLARTIRLVKPKK